MKLNWNFKLEFCPLIPGYPTPASTRHTTTSEHTYICISSWTRERCGLQDGYEFLSLFHNDFLFLSSEKAEGRSSGFIEKMLPKNVYLNQIFSAITWMGWRSCLTTGCVSRKVDFLKSNTSNTFLNSTHSRRDVLGPNFLCKNSIKCWVPKLTSYEI